MATRGGKHEGFSVDQSASAFLSSLSFLLKIVQQCFSKCGPWTCAGLWAIGCWSMSNFVLSFHPIQATFSTSFFPCPTRTTSFSEAPKPHECSLPANRGEKRAVIGWRLEASGIWLARSFNSVVLEPCPPPLPTNMEKVSEWLLCVEEPSGSNHRLLLLSLYFWTFICNVKEPPYSDAAPSVLAEQIAPILNWYLLRWEISL